MKQKLTNAILIGAFAASLNVAPVMGAEINNNQINKEAVFKQIENDSLSLADGSYFYKAGIKKNGLPEIEEWYKGWTTANVNVRREPSIDSEVLDVLTFNKKLIFTNFNEDWVKIEFGDGEAFVSKKYVSLEKCPSKKYSVPSYSGYKSWMDYGTITMNGSEQRILQEEYAYTGKYGIRQINGRYCVAIGSYFTTEVGRYFDLILENGEVIPCILADRKDDGDTDSDNIFTKDNGCATEFVVDEDALKHSGRKEGDISACCEEWNSPVKEIKIYQKVI